MIQHDCTQFSRCRHHLMMPTSEVQSTYSLGQWHVDANLKA